MSPTSPPSYDKLSLVVLYWHQATYAEPTSNHALAFDN